MTESEDILEGSRQIRNLLIKALIVATGASEDAVLEAPLTTALKFREGLKNACSDLEYRILEYANDIRSNASGGDDYPWEIMKGVADYLEVLIGRAALAATPAVDGEALSKAIVRLRGYASLLDVDVFADDNEPNLQEDIELVSAAAQLALMGDADLTHYEADAESVLAVSPLPAVGGEREVLENILQRLRGPASAVISDIRKIVQDALAPPSCTCPCSCDETPHDGKPCPIHSSQPASPLRGRESIAKIIYETEPHHESGEYVDGFQVSPGGNLSWEQAKTRDAEFGDDPLMGKITEFAYRCADALRCAEALPASPLRGRQTEQELQAEIEACLAPDNMSAFSLRGREEITADELAKFIHNYDRFLAKYIATNLLIHFSISPKSELAATTFSAAPPEQLATNDLAEIMELASDDRVSSEALGIRLRALWTSSR